MIYSTDLHVHPHDCDFSKQLSYVTLGSLFLDIAGRAANEHGFGMNLFHSKGAAWVLSRFSVEVYRRPKEYERVTIRTWIRGVNSIFSERFFQMLDNDGVVLVESASLWSVIDLKTRKMLDLTSIGKLDDFIVDQSIVMDSTKRVSKSVAESGKITTHNILYSDIDMNIHVNSMKYLQWVMDSFTLDFHMDNSISRYDINFLKEMRYPQVATILKEEQEDGVVFAISNEEKAVCCRIKISFLHET